MGVTGKMHYFFLQVQDVNLKNAGLVVLAAILPAWRKGHLREEERWGPDDLL